MATEFATIQRETATKSEIGTLTTRSEPDILMSRQPQETLEQMQKQRDEQTTTLNETVNHINKIWMTKSK